MPDSGLPAELKRFIAGYIASLEHLEILLLLRSSPDRKWTADSVYEVLKSSRPGVEKALADLVEMKLLSPRENNVFEFTPASPEIAARVSDLAEAYLVRRIRVVELIYSPELDSLREFLRAFRLRKGD